MLEVSAWLRERSGFDTVTVAVGKSGMKRSPRLARKALLELTEEGGAVWEGHGYRFDFSGGVYLWERKPVHVTAGEALFLYRWLVLGKKATANAFEIQHLRKRLGPGFLRELTGGTRGA
jgi:hypothetical protein